MFWENNKAIPMHKALLSKNTKSLFLHYLFTFTILKGASNYVTITRNIMLVV
jgi:hypothetical protein